MPSYSITFWKTIYDSSGHEHKVVQWANRVRAATPAAAMSRAERDFCAFNKIPMWDFRADSIEVNQASQTVARVARR